MALPELPQALSGMGWKVKIRNLERNEHPHVTIIRKTTHWRYRIREPRGFLDNDPDPRDVPPELVTFIAENVAAYRQEWDTRYPENLITSKKEDEDP